MRGKSVIVRVLSAVGRAGRSDFHYHRLAEALYTARSGSVPKSSNCSRRARRGIERALKFHRTTPAGVNIFTGYGPGYVIISERRCEGPVIVLPEFIIEPWAASDVASLTHASFAAVAPHAPEVILLGTGSRLRFPPGQLIRALAADRIGLEVMDTPAACRTYNILVAEGRKVAAALLFDPDATLE